MTNKSKAVKTPEIDRLGLLDRLRETIRLEIFQVVSWNCPCNLSGTRAWLEEQGIDPDEGIQQLHELLDSNFGCDCGVMALILGFEGRPVRLHKRTSDFMPPVDVAPKKQPQRNIDFVYKL